ncbi:MAG: amino acid adenylation domain-containing protein, partial [Rubripirellula sp.]
MTAVKLIKLLHSKQIQIWVEGERLRYRASKGTLTDDLRQEMRDHKTELVELLRPDVASGTGLSSVISKVVRGDEMQLSFAQERIWFLDQFQPGAATYNIPVGLQIEGELDAKALQDSVFSLHQKHEILRTNFPARDGLPCVAIAPDPNVAFEYQDLRELTADCRETQARQIAMELMAQPFDLASGPLFRTVLLKLTDTCHWLLISIHHIIFDGWSFDLLLKDLGRLYECHQRGDEPGLDGTALQYVDFAHWQREHLQGETLEHRMDFWRRELQGDLPVLQLPTDHPRPPVKRYRGGVVEQTFSVETLQSLRALSKNAESTLFMTLLAAYVVLLRRYTGQRDLTVGTPIAGRERAETHDMLGVFVNTLVLRFETDGSQSFLDLLQHIKEISLNAFEHQDVPFEKLVDELQPSRNLDGTPFFSTMFTFHQSVQASTSFEGLTLSRIPLTTKTSKFDMHMSFFESQDGLEVAVEYDSDLFEEETVGRFLSHMRVLLEGVCKDPKCAIEDLPLLPENERRKLLTYGGQKQEGEVAETDTADSIIEILQHNFRENPNKTAVVFEDEALTYAELERRACILADKLRQLGIKPEELVGIHLNRSPNLIIAILGTWMAGGAYVPLDPAFPKERLSFMVDDSKLRIVISEEALGADIPVDRNNLVQIDGLFDPPVEMSPSIFCADTTSDSLAYVIYTSGSTGIPKGVQIEHHALLNFLDSMRCEPGFSANDTLLAVTTLSFDISVLELFLPLLCGGKVVIACQDSLVDGRELSRAIDRFGVTVMQATPATWKLLLESGWKGDTNLKVLCGGEAMGRDLKEALVKRVGELWNMYGPTETTVWSTIEQMYPGEAPITVGKPIANTTTYVLDHRQQLVPTGVAGELHIGGEGLARGYWQRTDLTTEKFITDPFSDEPNARLYKTGD